MRIAILFLTVVSCGVLFAGRAICADDSTNVFRERPNVVYIMADDLGYGDLGCYGQTMIKTPHIDRLAKNGMKFTNFYAGSTVCAPSRCVLMTGLDTGHCYIRGNDPGLIYQGLFSSMNSSDNPCRISSKDKQTNTRNLHRHSR